MRDSGGQAGRGALGGVVLLAFTAAAVFVGLRYYAPYKDYLVVERELKAAVHHCVTLQGNDERCKQQYDTALQEQGIEFPLSGDVEWVRTDAKNIEVAFAYSEDVDLLVTQHTLEFRFHCNADPGGCVNDAE
ncbi:hypothetical protein L6R50_05475 [Myxococcota bacterium]|nr:hypothetical protein [Myxococcota bacterium]